MIHNKSIFFLFLMNYCFSTIAAELPFFGWFTKKYQEYQSHKAEEEKKKNENQAKDVPKFETGKKNLENRHKELSVGQKTKNAFQELSQAFRPTTISTLTKNVSFKLGLGREQTYAYLNNDTAFTEYVLGSNDAQKPLENFSINTNDTVADMTVIKNNNTNYKIALLVGNRDSDKQVSASKIYLGEIPINGNIKYIPVLNASEKNSSNMVNNEGLKTFINNPNRIASNERDLFFTQIGSDKLYKCTLSETLKENDQINQQKIEQYTGLFGTDLTSTKLAKIKGDIATGNVFFASQAPNLYMLDQNATAKFRDEIAGSSYLLHAHQNTLIYGRLYNDTKWYTVLWDKFTGKLKQFASFISETESGGKKGSKVRRIGYYAKFYGRNANNQWNKPSQISLDEDYEEAKMMAPVDTVIYGDVVKNYVMLPAAASEQFATVFIGKRRGMHFAIQSKKGQLFPKMLSWYKILKHSLYSDRGKELNIAPEDTLPRKLFIVQHKQNEHYLCIVMRSHVFLVMTPLEKIDTDPNKNYNVAMYCIYKPSGGRQEKKIVASSFFATPNFESPQCLFLIVRDERANNNLHEKFKLLFFKDLHEIIEEGKEAFEAKEDFDKENQRWQWKEGTKSTD